MQLFSPILWWQPDSSELGYTLILPVMAQADHTAICIQQIVQHADMTTYAGW